MKPVNRGGSCSHSATLWLKNYFFFIFCIYLFIFLSSRPQPHRSSWHFNWLILESVIVTILATVLLLPIRYLSEIEKVTVTWNLSTDITSLFLPQPVALYTKRKTAHCCSLQYQRTQLCKHWLTLWTDRSSNGIRFI